MAAHLLTDGHAETVAENGSGDRTINQAEIDPKMANLGQNAQTPIVQIPIDQTEAAQNETVQKMVGEVRGRGEDREVDSATGPKCFGRRAISLSLC